jgi:hypothetical protein
MALPSTSVWEVRPTNGSNTNGGGFDSTGTGTDFSQQNSKNTSGNNISTTDAVAAGSTTITSATAAFNSTITGNIIYLQGGSGSLSAGWYRATYVSATSITVDRSVASGTGITMNIGGALQTIPQANTNMANGHQTWVKAESTISISSGLTINFTSSTMSFIAGYTTTRGDYGQVTIEATASSITMVTISNNNNLNTFTFRNFVLNCNSESGTIGLATASFGNTIENIQVENYNAASSAAFDISGGGSQGVVLRKCVAYNGAGTNPIGFKVTANLLGTILVDCACLSQTGGNGFDINGGMFLRCIAANISGASSYGFLIQGNSQGPTMMDGCLAYTCGGDGFRFASSAFGDYGFSAQNCTAYGNGGYGFDNTLTALTAGQIYIDYCATGGNASGASNGLVLGSHCVTLTADPTTAGASNNFAPNSTSGGGAAIQAAGFPGALQLGGTGYLDIGPLQHQSVAASTVVIAPNITRLVADTGDRY